MVSPHRFRGTNYQQQRQSLDRTVQNSRKNALVSENKSTGAKPTLSVSKTNFNQNKQTPSGQQRDSALSTFRKQRKNASEKRKNVSPIPTTTAKPAFSRRPYHHALSGNQKPKPRLMCYWCSIPIAQDDSPISGPNHMPQSTGSFGYGDDVLESYENDYGSVSLNNEANGNAFYRGSSHSSPGKPQVIRIQPYAVRTEFGGDSASFSPPNVVPAAPISILSSLNRGTSLKNAGSQTRSFFDQTRRKSNESLTSLHNDSETSNLNSPSLSSALTVHLNKLSSLHDLYTSSLPSNVGPREDIINHTSSNIKALQSSPLKAFFSNSSSLLRNSKIQNDTVKDSDKLPAKENFPRQLTLHKASTLKGNVTDAGNVNRKNVQQSLLLDAWWRLRVYINAGHNNPWKK